MIRIQYAERYGVKIGFKGLDDKTLQQNNDDRQQAQDSISNQIHGLEAPGFGLTAAKTKINITHIDEEEKKSENSKSVNSLQSFSIDDMLNITNIEN